MLDRNAIDATVDRLEAAAVSRVPMRPPSALHHGFSLDDAYAVQEAWVARSVAGGRRRVGYKLGLTTPATQQALGVDRPIYGVLFADGEIPEGGVLPLASLVAPRVEPELAFVMKAPLAAGCSPAEALRAIAHAAPAMEIIDNRVAAKDAETGRARGALDIVADGGGVAGFAISPERFDPREVDLAAIETRLTVGETSETGRFSNVFGSPEYALVELARELGRRGGAIAAGDLVLTGSPLRPAPLASGDIVSADFGALGRIGFTVR